MFDGASNIQLGSEMLKIHYSKISVMCGVKHTVSLLFNYASQTPFVNQMVTAHKALYNLFGSGIYHKPHYILR